MSEFLSLQFAPFFFHLILHLLAYFLKAVIFVIIFVIIIIIIIANIFCSIRLPFVAGSARKKQMCAFVFLSVYRHTVCRRTPSNFTLLGLEFEEYGLGC